MRHFKVIRIAVTISLIVTMMIQSMVGACAVAQCAQMRCSVISDSAAICTGCDRCPASGDGELCCCCKPRSSVAQPSECPHQSPPVEGDEAKTSKVGTPGICLCGLASSPADRDQDRPRTSEEVEHNEYVLLDDVTLRPRRLASATLEISCLVGLPPRFSQRSLCVWRI